MPAPRKNVPLAVAALFVAFAVVLFFTLGTVAGAVVGSIGFAIFGWALTRRPSSSLVGKKCSHCHDGIFVDGQADLCPTCGVPLHARCLDAHAKGHA